ncbi:MAG: hypothetical protein O2829_07000 [Bacteroidetes bacterium]|nr:hypothetical protein [Bacteroidota bacterium]MDA1268824.1 hypothetical protein [Bacteroidota bacterium]
MDFGQIIYIVAIVAYFLYRASSKKKDKTLPDGEDASPEKPKKGLTFEDLLREIRDGQVPKIPELEQAPVPLPKPKSTYTSPKQDRPIVQPASSQEVILSEGLDYEETYSQPKFKPFYTNTEALSTLSENTRGFLFELPKELKNPYAELLKNPKSFRDAIVVSEILKTKYF